MAHIDVKTKKQFGDEDPDWNDTETDALASFMKLYSLDGMARLYLGIYPTMGKPGEEWTLPIDLLTGVVQAYETLFSAFDTLYQTLQEGTTPTGGNGDSDEDESAETKIPAKAGDAAAPVTKPLRGDAQIAVQPSAMSFLFDVTNSSKRDAKAFIENVRGGVEFAEKNNRLRLYAGQEIPLDIRETGDNREAFEIWARQGTAANLAALDEMAWDVIALSVTAAYQRGGDAGKMFHINIDDYFDWRGIEARSRTKEARQEIEDRLRLLSDPARLKFRSHAELYFPDPKTARKKKEVVITEGAFLVRGDAYWRKGQGRLPYEGERPDGYYFALGKWAERYLSERKMLGIYLRKIAQYDMARQSWERRMSWYLIFQMQAQSSYMKLRGDELVPQQGLRMESILDGSQIDWRPMAATNPGKVIAQFTAAAATLRSDGICDLRCQDGAFNGSDLPTRGRLAALLDRLYLPFPGEMVRPHYQKRNAVAVEGRKASQARKAKPFPAPSS